MWRSNNCQRGKLFCHSFKLDFLSRKVFVFKGKKQRYYTPDVIANNGLFNYELSLDVFSEAFHDVFKISCRLSRGSFYYTMYSCFEKGCPTKPYATMPKGIMGNGGLWYLIEALGVSAT